MPVALFAGVWFGLSALGIELTPEALWAAPFLIAAWVYAMYRISCRIFEAKEM